ncbi:hypothetical protein D9M71_640810 [compost metagenome]
MGRPTPVVITRSPGDTQRHGSGKSTVWAQVISLPVPAAPATACNLSSSMSIRSCTVSMGISHSKDAPSMAFYTCRVNRCSRPRAIGAASQPYRDTRPLLQGDRARPGLCVRSPCRSGLVSRKGRKAPPGDLNRATVSSGCCYWPSPVPALPCPAAGGQTLASHPCDTGRQSSAAPPRTAG